MVLNAFSLGPVDPARDFTTFNRRGRLSRSGKEEARVKMSGTDKDSIILAKVITGRENAYNRNSRVHTGDDAAAHG